MWAVLALLLAGPAFAALTDNGDGTVSDSATGLMWDQCSPGLSGVECATGLAGAYTWQQALALATTANAANYKGHNDWRLPNVNELESLVKIAASSPAIDTAAFPNTVSDWYWSSTIYTPNPAHAWSVYFYDGYTYANFQTYTFRVRLVRSGQSFAPFDSLALAAPVAVTPVPVLGPLGLGGVWARRRRGDVRGCWCCLGGGFAASAAPTGQRRRSGGSREKHYSSLLSRNTLNNSRLDLGGLPSSASLRALRMI